MLLKLLFASNLFLLIVFTVVILILLKKNKKLSNKVINQSEQMDQYEEMISLFAKDRSLLVQTKNVLAIIKQQLIHSTSKIQNNTTNVVEDFGIVISDINYIINSASDIIQDVKRKMNQDVKISNMDQMNNQKTLETLEKKLLSLCFNVLDELTIHESRKKADIEHLDQISENVSKMLPFSDEILKIALNTKILALNASVEATRAGKFGKAFAVVAKEVTDLALRAHDAAERIASGLVYVNQFIESSITTIKDSIRIESQFTNSTVVLLKGLLPDVLSSILQLGVSLDNTQDKSAEVKKMIENIIVNLQFEDITNQITHHSVTMLDHLTEEIESHGGLHIELDSFHNGELKNNLLEKFNQLFTMEEERILARLSLEQNAGKEPTDNAVEMSEPVTHSPDSSDSDEDDDDVTFF